MVADGVIYSNSARVKNLARITDYDRVDQGTRIVFVLISMHQHSLDIHMERKSMKLR